MYHLVVLLLLSGQPISAGTKDEATQVACEQDRGVLVPSLEAKMQAEVGPETSVVGQCMDDTTFASFMQKMGNAPPAMQQSNGEEKVD